jgi:predicted transposase YbfD/YdcC
MCDATTSHRQKRDFLEINYDIDEYRIVLEDAVGAKSTITQLQPNQANKGLGYHFAVDASQEADFEARLEKISIHAAERYQHVSRAVRAFNY